ncbi:KR domain-containing protein [Sphingobacteriales bacterium UPWRP_1]|nr:short-chain dehydrogenase [Sphingobacteriales bacterium TSM_CSS]PSJ73828.1 KR domain-containing protein [Sphingobacteriales bacterium UPWRP_1]
MNLSGNKILITGGATGIGLGLAERFLLENNTVIICGRREDKLNEAKARFPALMTKVCDLAAETDRTELYEWVSAHHPDLNVLVNNAGIQNWMSVGDENFYPKATAEITTNIVAPLHLTNLFLQLSGLTAIINVTSGLAFLAFSKVPVYCATKSFLHSFTLSLRHLLQDKNIEVIEMIPPALNTDLGGKGLHDSAPPVADFVKAVFLQLQEGKNELTFGFSDTVSKATPEEIKVIFNRMNPS